MRTFLELQNDTLRKIGDESDQDKMRDMVKDAINTVHRNVLTERRYDFMLWPRKETISVVADQQYYPLHPQFAQLLYAQNQNTKEWLEETPVATLVEAGDNLVDGEMQYANRFILTSLQNVKNQPLVAGTLVATTTGGTESAANKILVKGINSSGEYVEETLSNGAAWSTLTSSTVWSIVESISKLGGTFTRTVAFTSGATTILTLLATEYGRQYRQLELPMSPTTTGTLEYRFYRKPLKLVNDYDLPQIPSDYDDILLYGSLIDMQGYSRPTESELREWQSKRSDLIDQMQKQYQQARSLNGRANYITHIPRG